ncbi:protein CNPPD1 isoform X1 [Phthorimaea operculella]|nr:protein CNPPD1 isoform X1 [Phthorimaea operculella]
MSNISKRRKEGSRAKIKSMGDHKEFLKRITKTLYYGQLPSLPCLSLPVTEISCEVWSEWQRGRSVKRLHQDSAASISRNACVSPAALVLALLYMERLRSRNPDYLTATAPADLFLITLMVGNKFLQDDGEDEEVFCSEWASSAGLDLPQLKRLELQFLSAIDWNVFVNEKHFEKGLQWLERRVALKQARLRGFFTYSDLAAASDGAQLANALKEAAEASVAAAASYVASLFALVTSALVVSATCLPAQHLLAALSARSGVSLAPAQDHTFPPPLTPTQYIPNSTELLDDLLAQTLSSDALTAPACCRGWQRYREETVEKRNWFDGVVVYDWKSFEPWWSRTSVLNWLYQSSLVNPMQRWREKIDEYADLLKRELYSEPVNKKCGYYEEGLFGSAQPTCIRSRLNLSKLGALLVSVSDR